MLSRNTFGDKKLFIGLGLANLILFLLVYVPTNNFEHETYYKLYFLWELRIPFFEWMIVPYHLFNLLFLVPMFLLPRNSIKKLALSFALSTITAGVIFLLIPAQFGFERIVPDGLTSVLYKNLFSIDRTENLVPSLHVAYTMLYFTACVSFISNKLTQAVFLIVCMLIISSTVFIHQHHVVDVISGVALAYCSYWLASSMLLSRNSPRHQ